MNKVILVVIDGCRSDAVENTPTPNLDRIMTQGAFTLSAQTVTPSITLPVHFSIFTSLDPSAHGIHSNSARPIPSPEALSIIDLAKINGMTTAAVYNWGHLRELSSPGALDYSLFFNDLSSDSGDLKIFMAAGAYIIHQVPDFCFIYTGCLDHAGHTWGFMSDAYLTVLREIDEAIGIFLENLQHAGILNAYHIILRNYILKKG
jgi:predicted AlkP superfamily pyrophosphatase or phosphodiesterase